MISRKRSQLRQAAGDPLQRSTFRGRQVVLDEQMTMLEQIGDLLLRAACVAGPPAWPRSPWTAARGPAWAFVAASFLRTLATARKHRLGQFRDDVELADLMRHVAEHLGNRLWIQGRTIGGDAPQRQPAQLRAPPGTRGRTRGCRRGRDRDPAPRRGAA